jgi:Ca2+-transporting ATPase
MTVRVVVTASGRVRFEGSGYAPEGAVRCDGGAPLEGRVRVELERALAAADRASNAEIHEQDGRWIVQGDPTEGALLVAARKAGLESESLAARLPRIGEVPFSSERKLMSTVHREQRDAHDTIVFTKGAPDVLLARCTHEFFGEQPRPLTPERRKDILAVNDELAGQALRALGVAARRIPAVPNDSPSASFDASIERDLVFAGLIGMIDPPRPEARAAVAQARSAGIRG